MIGRPGLVVLLLCALTLAAYAPARDLAFVSVDDHTYVVDNPMVNDGLSLEGARWALTAVHSSNWMPLTWLSHMLDVSLFGLDPGAHHLVNVAIHLANACLLFALLLRAAGRAPVRGIDPIWLAATVAALFALHPTRVESVAWVAERKDTLATFFALLGLWLYAAPVPRIARVAAAMALSLLCKPMAVTLPFVMLLLDSWPLQRSAPLRARVLEKAPLFALSAASSVITYAAQSRTAMQSLDAVPLLERIGNALFGVVRYLGMLVWPRDLGFLYPRLDPALLGPTSPRVLASAALLLCLSALALRVARSQPWWIVGWLWMLGTLVPVIGLVQVGEQSIADRYTYLPAIGIFIAAVWGSAASAPAFALRRFALGVLAAAVVAACLLLTRSQLPHWRDSESLWRRSIAVHEANATAHDQLGIVLAKQGRSDAALTHHERAVQLRPDSAVLHNNLGSARARAGSLDGAAAAFARAVELDPRLAAARVAWADLLRQQGRYARAVEQFAAAIDTQPRLAEQARLRASYAEALRGELDANQVGFERAADDHRRALEQGADASDWRELRAAFAWLLATHPDSRPHHAAEAVALARQALDASGGSVQQLDRLAAAYAAAGEFEAAIENAELARRRAESAGFALEAASIAERLAGYREGRRYVER